MAEKIYITASLIELNNKTFRPGDLVEGLSETEETELLGSGMIYEAPNAKIKGSAKERKKLKELEEACEEKDLKNKELEAQVAELREENKLLLEKVKEMESNPSDTDEEENVTKEKK